jgi:hypothetical protein
MKRPQTAGVGDSPILNNPAEDKYWSMFYLVCGRVRPKQIFYLLWL